jgi:anthranilate phosphoribosyltransferase
MIQQAIRELIDGQDLGRDQARQVMEQIMTGQATPAQIGAFLVALRCKGETTEEIAGCAEVMREKATPIRTRRHPVIDTCGTGGDGSGTFNISTTVAFVAAGAGLCVAKHGNRAMSSRCGSADVLQELGVNIEAGPERVSRCLDEAGIGFLFAPLLHGAMKHAVGPRREIGVRTVFNILGPLTNPAGARRQLLGVYETHLAAKLAGVLGLLGSERALVVHGADGLDEVTLAGPTAVTEAAEGQVREFQWTPADFGLQPTGLETVLVSGPEESAAIIRGVLDATPGTARDLVVANSAAALWTAGRTPSLEGCARLAAEAIASGAAAALLTRLVEFTRAG